MLDILRLSTYWAKLNKDTLDTALEKFGIPKEVTVKVKEVSEDSDIERCDDYNGIDLDSDE